ncbi:hypothetical protein [Labrys wisconsinensis]|uniref:Uncharacterized protein n=1 Tax=Labrys wisconsinensis TaxID=425677 RepID=A0ABU0JGI6_9HYPH|nr:hypothetical protein [Labrys wisconsinensis]MDQ0473409.1 hypothetical protein [Labrys wisconsinensis]
MAAVLALARPGRAIADSIVVATGVPIARLIWNKSLRMIARNLEREFTAQ